MEIYRTPYQNELMHSDRLVYPNELYHHGIEGQKWGKRNGPPYPLNYSDHSAAEKKYMGRGISSSNTSSSVKYGAAAPNTAKAKPSKAPKDMLDDAIAVNGGENGKERSYLRHNNCAFCSVAYEMRRRGYDVRAQEAVEGVDEKAIYKATENFDKKNVKSFATRKGAQAMSIGMTEKEFNELTSTILKDGDNSRGQMLVEWKSLGDLGVSLGGHALNYEVKDGNFFLVDGQVGKVYSGKEAYQYLSAAINVKTNRTDNIKMNTKITEKYYTEKNDGRVSDDTKAERASIGAASATAALGFFAAHTALTIPFAPPMIIPTAILGAGAIASGIASIAFDKKATQTKEEKTMDVETKWQKEKRHEFYSTGKTSRKKEEGNK